MTGGRLNKHSARDATACEAADRDLFNRIAETCARKDQVADMVARILSLPAPPESEDASDALAVAITLAFRLRTATA